MAGIKKVVVLGATGEVGRVVVQALVEASFEVTAVSRSASATSSFPKVVTSESAMYDSKDSLVSVFRGQDAIVEAFNPAAAVYQETIVAAAVQAGIRHIITPDFSSDTFNEHVDELLIFEVKRKAQHLLEEVASQGSLRWTAIITGPFFDWAIPRGIFWINAKDKKITAFGSGNQPVTMSNLTTCGEAVVAVLQNPESYANRQAYFANYTISTNRLTEIVKEVTKPTEWELVNVPLATFFSTAKKMWDADTEKGVKDRLNTQAYQMLGTYGVFEESNRYGANFENKIEGGFQKTETELKQELKKALYV